MAVSQYFIGFEVGATYPTHAPFTQDIHFEVSEQSESLEHVEVFGVWHVPLQQNDPVGHGVFASHV